jgi:hypothetical protein
MITDALLNFVPIGGNLSLIAGAGVSVPSINTIDLLGAGVGVAPSDRIIGNATVFGAPDAGGVGGMRPELVVNVGTAFVTANGATLNVALQGAADTGAAGGYLPSTWQTLIETGALTAAQLTALQTIARFPWVPPFPANLRPRFLRLLFQVPAATNFTAGTIANALVTTVRDDQFNRYAAKNYTVA